MTKLRVPLREIIRDPLEEDQRKRILARIAAEPVRPGLVLWHWAASAAVAASLVLAGWLVFTIWQAGIDPDQGPADTVGQGPSDGANATALLTSGSGGEELDHTLRDRSVVELTPGAVVEVLEESADAVRLKLRRGSATFDVRPDGPRPWTVVAGNVTVEVTGTRFRVDRAPGRVAVDVIRGHVRITGGEAIGGPQELSAGQRAIVAEGEPVVVTLEMPSDPVDEPALDEPPAAADTDLLVEAEAREPDSDRRSEGRRVARGEAGRHAPDATSDGASWQDLARQREYREGYDLLGAEGVALESARAATMDELLLLADLARLSGHPREAVRPLERAMSEFPGDRRAASAAFSLGRVQIDVLGNARGGVVAFERCLALNPPRILREDAYARLAQARAATGDAAGAREAAETYLRLYPQGRRAEAMERIVGSDRQVDATP